MLSETCNPELGQNYGIQVLPDPKCLPHLLAPVALGILAARAAANSEYFCVCQSVLARACDAWLQQPLGNLPFPREIPAPASSMWLWVFSRESGDGGGSCCCKALGSRSETEFRRGQKSACFSTGKLVEYPSIAMQIHLFFFPAGKIKQNGNSWPPPLQMFGCEESLSPGITGIKPQQVVSPQLGSGSSWADALLPHSSVSCPARFWGGRKRLKSEQIKPVGQALRVPGLSGAYRVKFCSYSSSTW